MMRFLIYAVWRGQHVTPEWAAKPRKWHAQCRHPLKKPGWRDKNGKLLPFVTFSEGP